ncbi:MAG TPA: ISL3 family transposase [Anaerolineales bacterium]|nr:ISL3 family transposase [Anaerolineales bacterium]
MAKAQVTIPLEIPEVRVLKSELNKAGELIITVESTKETTVCRRCGRVIEKFHGYDKWMKVRYLPVFGHPTYLRYRPKRFRCEYCDGQPTTSQRLDWHEPNSPNTFAYEQHVLLQLVNTTVTDVSRKEQLAYDTILGIVDRHIQAEVDWSQHTALGTLGMDEIALKKGHRDYVVIVTARLKNGRVVLLGVLENRQKETVVEFLRSIPERLKRSIVSACCDMYEGFTEAVREELPHVRLVIDRFHVTRAYRDGLNNLRQAELKRVKRELPQQDYKALKGSMWALRKEKQDLSSEERRTLRRLFRLSPDLKTAYSLQNRLTAIFEEQLSLPAAKTKLKSWIVAVAKSGLRCFDRFINTLGRWWDEILNYFVERETSGFVEGFNNKIKVLKRRSYGMTNLKHLFQRIYLDLEGYRLFA